MVNISLGMAFVAGRNLVPRPATGTTAFLIFIYSTSCIVLEGSGAVGFIPRAVHGTWQWIKFGGSMEDISKG